MKIIINREQLLAAFTVVAPIAKQNSPKPILANVKLDVSKTSKTLLATDLEVGIRHELDQVDVEQPGAVILPVKRFAAILGESSDATFRIETDGTTIKVCGERSTFKLPANNPADFPDVPSFTEKAYYELPGRVLRECIKRTIVATSNDSSRYALGGVKLEWNDGVLFAIATDGRRLAKMESKATAVGDAKPVGEMTVVPARALNLIEKTLPAEGDVQLSVQANDVIVRTPQATIYARLLEGRFPRWRDVLPVRQNSTKIDLVSGPLYSAVRQASITTSEESKGVDFTFKKGELVLASTTAEIGDSRIELPISYSGEKLVITLDPRFVIEFLKVLGGDKSFTLDLKDEDSPALFTTDDGYGYVIMPLARDR